MLDDPDNTTHFHVLSWRNVTMMDIFGMQGLPQQMQNALADAQIDAIRETMPQRLKQAFNILNGGTNGQARYTPDGVPFMPKTTTPQILFGTDDPQVLIDLEKNDPHIGSFPITRDSYEQNLKCDGNTFTLE